VTDPHPASGYHQDLVLFRELPDLFHEGEHHLPAVVDHPMAPDLDDVQVGNQSELVNPVVLPHQPLSDQSFTLEPRFDLMSVGHISSWAFSLDYAMKQSIKGILTEINRINTDKFYIKKTSQVKQLKKR